MNTYPDSLGPTTDMANPQQACLFEEQREVLQHAHAMLSPEERKSIETAFFSELTYAETAQKLAQPLGTVKTRIRGRSTPDIRMRASKNCTFSTAY